MFASSNAEIIDTIRNDLWAAINLYMRRIKTIVSSSCIHRQLVTMYTATIRQDILLLKLALPHSLSGSESLLPFVRFTFLYMSITREMFF